MQQMMAKMAIITNLTFLAPMLELALTAKELWITEMEKEEDLLARTPLTLYRQGKEIALAPLTLCAASSQSN